MTVRCVAVSGYRSLHTLCFAPGPLTVITGGNGVGKSNVYRALELMHAAAHGRLAITLAREGGLASAAWAGPDEVRTPGARRRNVPIQGTVRQRPIRVTLGMQLDAGSFEMVLGHAQSRGSAFSLDPEVKVEWLWAQPPRRPQTAWLTRDHTAARCQDSDGRWRSYTDLDPGESTTRVHARVPRGDLERLLDATGRREREVTATAGGRGSAGPGPRWRRHRRDRARSS